jgi:hypothetical protein
MRQAADARDKLGAAVIGLLLILASLLIIQIINPELTHPNQAALERLQGTVLVSRVWGISQQGPVGQQSSIDQQPPEQQPPVGQTGTDPFGIKMLYPTATGGPTWDSGHWSNGSQRVLNHGAVDPADPTAWSHPTGSSSFTIDGNGLLISQHPDPRFYIDNSSFLNIEVTVYYRRLQDQNVSNGGLVVGVRSGNHSDSSCAHTYYGRFGNGGEAVFVKELLHPTAGNGQSTDLFGSGLPRSQWIGMKFVVYNTAHGVKLELYRDLTDGQGGGQWERVLEQEDTGGWISGMASCPSIISTNGFAFLRNTGNLSSSYKWLSMREITPP